jgi:hypothetical protein
MEAEEVLSRLQCLPDFVPNFQSQVLVDVILTFCHQSSLRASLGRTTEDLSLILAIREK